MTWTPKEKLPPKSVHFSIELIGKVQRLQRSMKKECLQRQVKEEEIQAVRGVLLSANMLDEARETQRGQSRDSQAGDRGRTSGVVLLLSVVLRSVWCVRFSIHSTACCGRPSEILGEAEANPE